MEFNCLHCDKKKITVNIQENDNIEKIKIFCTNCFCYNFIFIDKETKEVTITTDG